MDRISRELFLQSGASAAAALAMGAGSVGLAEAAAPSRLNDIDHFIILMQENRSFDHYFGSLRGVRGFDDAHAAKLPSGGAGFSAARSGARRRVRVAVPSRYGEDERDAVARSQSRLGSAARVPQRREDGRLGGRASRCRRRVGAADDGLLHARGHAVLLCAGGCVYDLRRLPLLDALVNVSESAVLDDGIDRSGRQARRARAQQ